MMIIAFLDLLGFSYLIKKDINTASDTLQRLNKIITTKIIDERKFPKEYYEDKNGRREFVENTYITSFENIINISDSIIIGAHDADLFIRQISSFLTTVFMSKSETFERPQDLNKSDFPNTSEDYNVTLTGKNQQNMAFPTLFRGGISAGNQVRFFKQGQVFEGKYISDGLNIEGEPYIKA